MISIILFMVNIMMITIIDIPLAPQPNFRLCCCGFVHLYVDKSSLTVDSHVLWLLSIVDQKWNDDNILVPQSSFEIPVVLSR